MGIIPHSFAAPFHFSSFSHPIAKGIHVAACESLEARPIPCFLPG
eukprot:SAG31_NODE_1460_length_8241_cov_11.816352_5_plen_45_part_00